MKIRYYIDPKTGLPRIYQHSVSEQEDEGVLEWLGEDRLGYGGSRVAIGRTLDGRYLRVIYVPEELDGIFVIAAYTLHDKPLSAYRRRQRRKRQ